MPPLHAPARRRRTRTFFLRALVTGAAVLSATLTVIAGVLASRWLETAAISSQWVRHTYAVIGALADVTEAVTEVETAQRGFLLTGDVRFLEPFERRRDVIAAFERAHRLTVDNPGQQRRLDSLAVALHDKLAFSEQVVALAAAGERDSAVKLVRAGTGLAAMRRVQALAHAAVVTERKLLARRVLTQNAEISAARRTVVVSLLAAALAAALALATLRREAIRLARANRKAEEAERRALESEVEAWGAERAARRSTRHAREREAQYRLLFESNPVPAWVYDQQTLAFLAVNPAACRHYGYSAAEFLRMTLHDIRPVAEAREVADWAAEAAAHAVTESERTHQAKDGRLMTVALSSHALTYDGRPGRLVLAHDLTELRRAEAALAELAVRDELTGLLNRRGFRELAEQETKVARRAGRSDAALYLDLDGFKPVNDTYGHAEGDAALRAVAAVLRATVREGDIVARLGGDEFAVYAPGLGRPGEGRLLAGRLVSALAEHSVGAQAAGRPYRLGASVGVSELEPGDDLDAMLARADAALYAQKAARKRVA